MNEIYLSIIAGLSIGFLGSLHCIGMCGPIALMLPVAEKGASRYIRILLYNLGRAITYAMLGLLFGFMGSRFRLWGLQQFLSIAMGILILLFIFSSFNVSGRLKWFVLLKSKVQSSLSLLLRSPKNSFSFLSIGILNGLLPCGLVYVAISSATATGRILDGALLMLMFGLGTIPMMTGLMLFGRFISFNIRRQLSRVVPVFISALALILIMRGMNLGIPYVSPKMVAADKVEFCHH